MSQSKLNQSNRQTDRGSLDRRALIIQAAIVCFIDKGFHATSMRDIALAASVSLGNLYNYFPSKQALIAEVANQEQAELAPLLHSLERVFAPSMSDVQLFLTAYWRLCRQHDWAVLSAECLAEIARNPELVPAFAHNRQQLVDTLVNAVERGTQQGNFKPAAPAQLVSQALLDIVESDALRQTLMTPASTAASTVVTTAAIANDQTMEIIHPGLLRGMLGA
ncbi:TetR/AcrR family transcriptional regulator [Pigmentiphaga aceris]|uniref:TetR/AcrR family transcriptional regulator n=2 Tax=Pigmentiphaga aceris TaxID=1940612 RepID=A0A5C0B6P6_9BURK|nr:TetR/AcrR family transcriptional regulator [Pigmentiphaga aceris]